jgi:hypothetical protein
VCVLFSGESLFCFLGHLLLRVLVHRLGLDHHEGRRFLLLFSRLFFLSDMLYGVGSINMFSTLSM